MSKNIFNSIKIGIERGVYTTVRLVQLVDDKRTILMPYNKIGGNKEQALHRLETIKFQLEKKLEAGTYVLEARMGDTANARCDSFEYILKAPVMLQPSTKKSSVHDEEIIDKTKEQETTMAEISMQDYIDKIEEVAKLRSDIEMLKLRIEIMSNAQQQTALSEPASTIGNTVMKVLEDHLPTAMSIFDKFMEQRDRSLSLKDRELSLSENGNTKYKKKAVVHPRDKKASDMERLMNSDEEAFNNEMDRLQDTDIEMYNYICDKLDLVDEEEEEQD